MVVVERTDRQRITQRTSSAVSKQAVYSGVMGAVMEGGYSWFE